MRKSLKSLHVQTSAAAAAVAEYMLFAHRPRACLVLLPLVVLHGNIERCMILMATGKCCRLLLSLQIAGLQYYLSRFCPSTTKVALAEAKRSRL